MSEITKIIHLKSNTPELLPSSDRLQHGELAINYHKDTEMLAIKNDNGEVIPFFANYGYEIDENGEIDNNGYEYVDMGLSVKWATCNIGANKPEEYGWYFQWAGTIAYNSNRIPVSGGSTIIFEGEGYPYWVSGSNSSLKLSKYTVSDSYSSTGTADNKTVLDLEDDAAHVHLGGGWRMPTREEYQELYNACDTTWTTNYNGTGIVGKIFTLKSDTSKQLFFPAAGYGYDSSIRSVGSSGHYWSSSLYTNTVSAYDMGSFISQDSFAYSPRYYGYNVRGVITNTKIIQVINGGEF